MAHDHYLHPDTRTLKPVLQSPLQQLLGVANPTEKIVFSLNDSSQLQRKLSYLILEMASTARHPLKPRCCLLAEASGSAGCIGVNVSVGTAFERVAIAFQLNGPRNKKTAEQHKPDRGARVGLISCGGARRTNKIHTVKLI